MTVSPLSFAIAVTLVGVYAILFAFIKKDRPNLGTLFLLFLVGPVVTESLDVMSIFYRLTVDKQPLEFGVLKDHVFVVAFTGIALLYAAVDAVIVNFKQLGKPQQA